jgi:tRNA (guanine-N7-)-methyltransferase
LRPGRRRLLEERLPQVRFSVEEGARVRPERLFAGPVHDVWLEIGFGGGEHLAAQAARHPEIGFIGVEPFVTGVAKLLAAQDEQGSDNIRVLVDDARLLLRALPDKSIGFAFILFPDPWPKTRHHKRRIVSRETVGELARILKAGGGLRLATDDPGYARWMLEALLAEPRLEWLATRAADWREPPTGWVETRYEAKARAAARRPTYFDFRRLAEQHQ